MLSGSASADDAMEAAVKNANAAIEDYNRRMGR
jgi:F0F1-type ATP synthase gamma subunit